MNKVLKLGRVVPTFFDDSRIPVRLSQTADVLQIDAWPILSSCQSPPYVDDCQLSRVWCNIHRWLYLRPELTVVTNAGGRDVVCFMEWMGDFLAKHGSRDMPVAAIRCGSLLDVVPPGLVGRECSQVAVEIGAGPIVTAFADGARIIVTGEYDIASPFIGAALSRGIVRWNETDKLAAIAVASHLEGAIVHLGAEGSVQVERIVSKQLNSIVQRGVIEHADVVCDCGNLMFGETFGASLSLSVNGEHPGDDGWTARLTVRDGFHAVILVQSNVETITRLSELCASWPRHESVEFDELEHAKKRASSERFLRIRFHSNSSTECQSWCERLQFWLRKEFGAQISDSIAVVQERSTMTATRVPKDRISLSVETRPAYEWI